MTRGCVVFFGGLVILSAAVFVGWQLSESEPSRTLRHSKAIFDEGVRRDREIYDAVVRERRLHEDQTRGHLQLLKEARQAAGEVVQQEVQKSPVRKASLDLEVVEPPVDHPTMVEKNVQVVSSKTTEYKQRSLRVSGQENVSPNYRHTPTQVVYAPGPSQSRRQPRGSTLKRVGTAALLGGGSGAGVGAAISGRRGAGIGAAAGAGAGILVALLQ